MADSLSNGFTPVAHFELVQISLVEKTYSITTEGDFSFQIQVPIRTHFVRAGYRKLKNLVEIELLSTDLNTGDEIHRHTLQMHLKSSPKRRQKQR